MEITYAVWFTFELVDDKDYENMWCGLITCENFVKF